MKKFMVLLLLLAFVVTFPIACGGGEDQTEGEGEGTIPPGIPDWALNTPSEPGQAFYGVGQAAYASSANIQGAISAASQSARQQIAESMRTRIQAAVMRYMQSVLTSEGDFQEESLSRTVSRGVTDQVISGAAIVATEVTERDEQGVGSVWCLARIGFDGVASALHEHTQREVDKVVANAEHAFDELDALLAQQQEEEDGERPYTGTLPEGTE